MKELIRHIEILLLENDCVVVPQIGGFVTCHAPAQYIEEEHLFFPPKRTVGFNERIKNDDGLLVQTYMKTYQCQEVEAKRKLGEQVRDIQQELWENGSCDMGSLGVLELDRHNEVQFTPCQAGTVCPAFYGLDALSFAPLETFKKENEAILSSTVTDKTNEDIKVGTVSTKNDNEVVIRLKKTWIQNVAAVAALVFLFFLISPQAFNSGLSLNEKAAFAQLMIIPGIQEVSPIHNDECVIAPIEISEKSPQLEIKQVISEKEDVKFQEGGYCVVVASAITERNANRYVEQLHKDGYNEARVYKNENIVRVVFPGFSTASEAYKYKNMLSRQSKDFASAWVYHIK